MINFADVPATELIQPGSRVSRAVLFAGDPADVAAFREWLTATRQPGERLQAIEDASPQIRASSDRAGRFLSLASLVSVLLSAVAVAMAARRYAARHLDTVALMKCMGASQGFVMRQTVLQLVAIAVLVTLAGTALATSRSRGSPGCCATLIRSDLPPPGVATAWLGLVTSVTILVGFALPPLLQLKRVPPARVLRRNLEPPPLRYAAVYVFAIGAVLALLYWLVRDPRLVTVVAGGIGATFVALALAGWLLVRGLAPLRRGVGVAWRYGLANIARRGRDSVVQIVAFGLGLMVLLLLALVRDDLLRDWRASLPDDAPNYFMINIRPDEGDAVRAFFRERGLPPSELVPLVRARLTAINDVPVDRIRFEGDRAQGFVEREANLTWARTLRDDNRLVSGAWWTDGDEGGSRVSVEQEYAERLGLKLGDTVTYDVAGSPSPPRSRACATSAGIPSSRTSSWCSRPACSTT